MIFVILFLFVLMLPFGILLGLLGVSVKALGIAAMFALKYLLPAAVIGFAVAKKRARDSYFPTKRYFKYMAIAMAAGFVLLLVALRIPIMPDFPEEGTIKSVNVSYEVISGTQTASTETDELINDLLQTLGNMEYTPTIKEFIKEEDDCLTYTLDLTDAEGRDYTLIFGNYKVLGIEKGGITFYYKVKGDKARVPVDWARNVFTIKQQGESEAIWQPFAEELFSTIAYDDECQTIRFVIPEVIPEGVYSIEICMEGVRDYTEGEFEPHGFVIYEEEQKEDLWVPGEEYPIILVDECFSRFDIMVNAPYLEQAYTFDVLPLLPDDRVYP